MILTKFLQALKELMFIIFHKNLDKLILKIKINLNAIVAKWMLKKINLVFFQILNQKN